jgi:hypothetical protein
MGERRAGRDKSRDYEMGATTRKCYNSLSIYPTNMLRKEMAHPLSNRGGLRATNAYEVFKHSLGRRVADFAQ